MIYNISLIKYFCYFIINLGCVFISNVKFNVKNEYSTVNFNFSEQFFCYFESYSYFKTL